MKVKCNDCQAIVINGHACHETGCNGTMLYIKGNKTFVKYRVFSLDIWGNVKDGFEVNDRQFTGMITVPLDAPDKKVIQSLKQNNLLNKRCRFKSFKLDEYGIESTKTGKPIYQLEIA